MASLTEKIANFFGGNDSTTDEGLRDLFISELKTLYYVEKQILNALGDLAEASTTNEVRTAFLKHQDQSHTQIERIEQIFRIIDIQTDELPSSAIDGLIDDAQTRIGDTEDDSLTRDAALIISAQQIESYEIAGYRSLLTQAQVLGFSQSAELITQTLAEEKAMDKQLNILAESFINKRSKEEEDKHPGSHHASRHHIHPNDATLGGSLGI